MTSQRNHLGRTTLAMAGFALGAGLSLSVSAEDLPPSIQTLVEMGYPAPQEGDLVHIPPTMADLEASDMHRSEEHTSELQSRGQLVCRLLLEKKKCKTSACEVAPAVNS